MTESTLIHAIDALLPQTQCGKCGHPGCLPYAKGIAEGEDINKCPPGGESTVKALAELLRKPVLPLALPEVPTQIAVIREAECIGCTKCIQACPVDAIFGAAKLMHTVITAECTGCELCIAPCPVDCIDMVVLEGQASIEQRQKADHFRSRHNARLTRLEAAEKARQQERLARKAPVAVPAEAKAVDDAEIKRLKIAAAMAKVALTKVQKQFETHQTEALKAQVERLTEEARRAQSALENAQKSLPQVTEQALNALKQAKIALAMQRAELAKAERNGAPEDKLILLREALKSAENALHIAEDTSGKPAPTLTRNAPQVSDALRDAKTEYAYAKADLLKLERRQTPEGEVLQEARIRLKNAEAKLRELGA